jgi:hypothetical protein
VFVSPLMSKSLDAFERDLEFLKIVVNQKRSYFGRL